MAGHRLEFRPDGTLLLHCEVPLVYDCTKPPKIGDIKPELGTFATFGLLLTHEYVIHQARIESVMPCEGVMPNCKDAKAYEITLHYWLSHKLKLTLGKSVVLWSSPKAREFWKLSRAESVCCDRGYEPPALTQQRANLHAGAYVGICGATAAPGGVLARLHDYSSLQTGETVVVNVVAVCLCVVFLRLIWPWLTAKRQRM